MWYAKMYFSGEREFFENDAFGMQGLPSKQLELPFLESLLTFLELDEKEITPMLERISVNWEHFVESSDLGAHTAAMVELGMLAEKHIYFRLLYTRCFGCISVNGFDQAEIQAIALDLKEFAKQFSETRKQVEKFLECVLDVDSAGREPQKQAAKNYHHDQPRDPELFRFEPIPQQPPLWFTNVEAQSNSAFRSTLPSFSALTAASQASFASCGQFSV